MANGHENDDRRVTYFAATHTRGRRELFGIRAEDRGKHIYVIGKTGMGKSTMLENMAIQDIQNGEGIAFIDPHGSTAEKLLDFVPRDRIKDVVYFAPFDTDYPVGFNVMEDVGYDRRHLVVSGLMGAFRRIWVDAWSARMEYILQNTLLALLEYPGSTLLDVNRMLVNANFRAAVVEKITDPLVRDFWTAEFANYTDSYTREATPAIQNKVGQFVANPLIRNIVGQPKSTFDLRRIMDEKKIFIVNLSKGRMGETNAALLGSMLTVKIYLAAMSRAEEPAAIMRKLPRFYFYVDEFQSMMNEAFADILSESRKYKLALTLANQYIEQMEENVRDAVFGNVGTLVTFRVGPFDAEVLKTVFEPTFHPEDLVNLGIGQIYLTLMIDGVGSPPFSAETIPPIEAPAISYRDDIVRHTREAHASVRTQVERAVSERQKEHPMPVKAPKDRRGAQGSGFIPSRGNGAPRDRFVDRPRDFQRPADAPPVIDERARPAPVQRSEARPEARVEQPMRSAPRERPREERYERPHHRAPMEGPSKREANRDALRDAIQAAQAQGGESGRSPADIMRSKQSPRHEQSKDQREPIRPPRDGRPSDPQRAPVPERAGRPSERAAREEVSPELLQRVLNGDNE